MKLAFGDRKICGPSVGKCLRISSIFRVGGQRYLASSTLATIAEKVTN